MKFKNLLGIAIFFTVCLLFLQFLRLKSHTKLYLSSGEINELVKDEPIRFTPYNVRRNRVINYTKIDIKTKYLESKNLKEFKPFETNVDEIHFKSKLPPIPDGLKTSMLKEDDTIYFRNINNTDCYLRGLNLEESLKLQTCVCIDNYYGKHCSIPEAIWFSDLPKKYISKITTRKSKPRRIIVAFPFNMELELLNARISLTYDFVDAFVILESNYTGFGDRKPLFLYDALRQGYYQEFEKKLVYVHLNFYPKEASGKAGGDGWIADALFRNYMGQHGMTKQLKGYRHDDILLMHDADELIMPEVTQFLKLHDNYPEPFGVNLKWNIYGFFWQGNKPIWHIMCGCTMGFLAHVLNYKAYEVRTADRAMVRHSSKLNSYLKTGVNIRTWDIGSEQYPAGWHCSWCGSPETVRHKLESAINADFPRWGNYPEKRKLPFIKSLINNGIWFDEQSRFTKCNNNSKFYAPPYLLRYRETYKYLLENV
ncbi:unnamed protein product [Dimorphilus gyrociliatus]|uniref:Uncharacterized protein n=1 Tax=Dimorphilus gyrociliatus TaxID=2664684 RepID=A0A7I8VFT4_9ANNE|nr:unnamed protein product [Dimorphilus gyrociliatus]